jgi:hypothetical protein
MAADKTKPMRQLRELLKDGKLRARLQEARSMKDVLKLLNTAGAQQGYKFADPWLSQLAVDVKATRGPDVFTEQEWLLLSSSSDVGDTTPPMLCHTDSCGGTHTGCC